MVSRRRNSAKSRAGANPLEQSKARWGQFPGERRKELGTKRPVHMWPEMGSQDGGRADAV